MNPYGRFELDMNSRLALDLTALAATEPAPRAPWRKADAARHMTAPA
ncbi:hypothetical protein [Streptomyces sp. JH34]|nr:hypothetical protein [Streptomyces sp. JH34]MDF6016974.1 hypothetical protein [Streptomyces sp. JH34]